MADVIIIQKVEARSIESNVVWLEKLTDSVVCFVNTAKVVNGDPLHLMVH